MMIFVSNLILFLYKYLLTTEKSSAKLNKSHFRVLAVRYLSVFSMGVWLSNSTACFRFSEETLSSSTQTDSSAQDSSIDTTVDAPVSLCEQYGGYSNVRFLAAAFARALQEDCRLRAFFSGYSTSSLQHQNECNEILFAALFRCSREGKPIVYPDVDSKGVMCRDLKTAHVGLNASSADFEAFMQILGNVLQTAKVSSTDIDAIKKLFNFSRGDVVEQSDAGLSRAACPSIDASPDVTKD